MVSREDVYLLLGVAGLAVSIATVYVISRRTPLASNYQAVGRGGWNNDEVTEIERDPKTGFIVRETIHRAVEYGQ